MTSFTVEKCPQSYDEYKFALDAQHLEKTRIDLNETDENRAQSLAQMREWIAKHPHIKKCRTDSVFLLRFLRMRKFSVPMAQESLERYLTALRSFPQWFRNLDPLDGEIRLFNKAGMLTNLGRDSLGRTVVLLRARAFDPERFTSAHFVRQIMLLLETTIDEEEAQINGYVVVADYEAVSLKVLSVWSLTDVSNASDSLFQSFPLRIQEIHAIGVPRFLKIVSDMALSCMSEKIRNRVYWFKNLDPLDAEIRLFNKAGVLTSLGRDSLGRTIVLLAFNPERFTSAHFVRQIMLLLETTIEEEESQINGYVVIADYEAISLKQLSVWSLTDVSNASDSLFQSFPLRIQEIHAIRVPRFFKMVSDLALSCMSEKIRNRVTWFRNLDPLNEEIRLFNKVGMLFILGRDSHGRTVVLFRPRVLNVLNTEQATVGHQMRQGMLLLETTIDEEDSQINGYVAIADFEAITLKLLSVWTSTDVSNAANYLFRAFPLRIQEIHAIGVPRFFKIFANLALSCMSEKIRNRVYVKKCPQSYDEYKFALDSRHLEKVRIEQNETDENRAQSLAQMREWITKHPHIKKCRTDSMFLLRFLRMRKFSVPMAQESLERYLTALRSFPQWFRNLDPLNGDIRLFNKVGMLFNLGRDSHGRTVVLFRPRVLNVLDTERATLGHQMRQAMLLLETTIEEEETQINGYVAIADYEAISLKLLSMWPFTDVSNAADNLFHSLPCHKSLDDAKKHLELSLLTTDYEGGTQNPDQLTEDFIKCAERKRTQLLLMDEMEIDTSRYQFGGQQNTVVSEIEAGMVGSFKKLNVD
ncbi:hypothetical protein pipiens_009191 [Culex pipiens pipiens]|uniref:CRAL-TRIO domain-containing protein n=1 Tax=Culex pipiens pipiens TaxID=38569 RepID=A0ABD1DF01_CULPP